MCIGATDEILIAEEDVVVYKVFHKNFKDEVTTLFRNIRGYEANYKSTIGEVIEHKAIGFDKGYGYSCFYDKDTAYQYSDIVDYGYTLVIEMIIPKGTRFDVGIIKQGFKGYGLKAIRTERLKRR